MQPMSSPSRPSFWHRRSCPCSWVALLPALDFLFSANLRELCASALSSLFVFQFVFQFVFLFALSAALALPFSPPKKQKSRKSLRPAADHHHAAKSQPLAGGESSFGYQPRETFAVLAPFAIP